MRTGKRATIIINPDALSVPEERKKAGTLTSIKKKELLDTLSQNGVPFIEIDLETEKRKSNTTPVKTKGAKQLAKALTTNTTVQSLNLKGNSIGKAGAIEIGESLKRNTILSLVELNLSENSLENEGTTFILEAVESHSTLRILNLESNSIREPAILKLKDLLSKSTTLRELHLSHNPKVGKNGTLRLCEGLKENESLEILNARKIGIGKHGSVYLNDALKVNQTLTSLDIGGNNLSDLGLKNLLDSLQTTHSLTRLNLSQNKLTKKSAQSIAEGILKNKVIRFLDLSGNKLGKVGSFEIAEGLKENETLASLKLGKNGIGSEGASNLFQSLLTNHSITYLDVSHNGIGDESASALAKVFQNNSTLKTLILTGNSYRAPEAFGSLQKNQSLMALYLSENPLKSDSLKLLAEQLRQNKSLIVLELKLVSANSETETAFGETYQASQYLASLWLGTAFFSRKYITHRSLTSFPMSFLQMTHLKYIDLSNNKITELPQRIGDLQRLKELNLRNNELEYLPYTLATIPALKMIDVEGNPLKVPPKEIVKKGRKEILGYLKDLAEGAEPCYRTKLMIVGQENVGKTTLVNHLHKKKQKNRTKRSSVKGTVNITNISTDGIDIDHWDLNVLFQKKDDPKPRKQTVSLSVWDFAGQEIYYTSHQFFLSDRSIYILVFDLRHDEENSRVEYWLQSIHARAKNAPVLLVGTHADDPKCTTEYLKEYIGNMQRKYIERFPNIKKFLVADATNDVKNVLIGIKECIAIQSHMGEPMPLTYIELENVVLAERDRLKAEGKPPIINWRTWTHLGQIANINDEGTLSRATVLLHELGVVVHIDDKKSGLNDLVILLPQYLTTLMSTVITTKHRFIKDGILYHRDLSQIWRDPVLFPPQLHPYFLAMMENFEISMNLDSKTKTTETIDPAARSLIPSLLPEQEPAKLEWKGYDPTLIQLDRFYELEFVPHGFFSRLIIRMMQFADNVVQYWRYGGIFSQTHAKSSYFIRLLPEQRLLKITVRSREPVPLARSIMETITNLLSSWFRVSALETVPCPHCIAKSGGEASIISSFAVSDCTAAIAEGKLTLKCGQDGSAVALRDIVPDISLSDVNLPIVDFAKDISLGKQLGKGAFGEIYEATWKNHSYAVKKLVVDEDEEEGHLLTVFHEFRREVWVMSRLVHPCVINLVAFSFTPFSMVMEKASEGSLYNFLHNDKNSLNWNLRIRIALDIAQGMKALHSFDPPLVHRDLKSPNILLVSTSESSEVVAKVSDFGTAMQLFITAFKESASERAVALPTWLAPEVIGETEYTEKSDIYAMGIMMWELVTRKHPFSEYTWMTELEDAILEGNRPKIPSDCPPSWRNLMRSCWDPEPDVRPSFAEIVDILHTKVLPSISPSFKVNLMAELRPSSHHTTANRVIHLPESKDDEIRRKSLKDETLLSETEKK